ncbi:hypothetical protein [Zoogloea sp.]
MRYEHPGQWESRLGWFCNRMCVRYLGIEVDDALEISEQTEI